VALEETDAPSLARITPFVHNTFPILADAEHEAAKLLRPTSVYLIDRKGVLRLRIPGSVHGRPSAPEVVRALADLEGVPVPAVAADPPADPPAAGGGLLPPSSLKPKDPLDARWMFSHNRVRPGDAFKLAFLPTVASGWHLYAHEETSVIPFQVEVILPEGVTLQKPVGYPAAQTLEDPTLGRALRVYEKDVPLDAILLQAADTLQPGPLTLKVKLRYQACNDRICLPPADREFPLTLPVVPKGTPRHPVFGWESW